MTTIRKQLVFNRLLLPFDMNYEIYGFVFQEKKKIDKMYKENWEKCMISIRNAYIATRIIEDELHDEHWAFWSGYSNPQFQAISCGICGEYKESDTMNIPIRLLCRCNIEEQEDWDEEDDTYDY